MPVGRRRSAAALLAAAVLLLLLFAPGRSRTALPDPDVYLPASSASDDLVDNWTPGVVNTRSSSSQARRPADMDLQGVDDLVAASDAHRPMNLHGLLDADLDEPIGAGARPTEWALLASPATPGVADDVLRSASFAPGFGAPGGGGSIDHGVAAGNAGFGGASGGGQGGALVATGSSGPADYSNQQNDNDGWGLGDGTAGTGPSDDHGNSNGGRGNGEGGSSSDDGNGRGGNNGNGPIFVSNDDGGGANGDSGGVSIVVGGATFIPDSNGGNGGGASEGGPSRDTSRPDDPIDYPVPAPEPATLVLLGSGLVVLARTVRRRDVADTDQ